MNDLKMDFNIPMDIPMPMPLTRQGGESRYNPAIDVYRNKLTDKLGILMPEPLDPFKIYDHLTDIEESSFVRGDIKDVGEYIRENGVIAFIEKTKYNYSLPCILFYNTVAEAQKKYILEQLK
jgi:hypothetical protein